MAEKYGESVGILPTSVTLKGVMNGIKRAIPGHCFYCEDRFTSEERMYGAIKAVRGGHEWHLKCVNEVLREKERKLSEVDTLKVS